MWLHMYKGFDDAKDRSNSSLLQFQIQDQVSKRSREKIHFSPFLLKESLKDWKGLALKT